MSDDSDGQCKVVLRNSTSDVAAFWQFTKIAALASGATRNIRSRPFALLAIAILHIVSFGAAGIFSSRVTNTRSEVLLVPTHCGGWQKLPVGTRRRPEEHIDLGAAHDMWVVRGWHLSSLCRNSSTESANCNAYGRQLPSWTTKMHEDCPFAQSMCINGTVVRLDSGVIDSHLNLGINAPPSSRITFRKITDCAPLAVEGFMKRLPRNTSDALVKSSNLQREDDERTGYYYGRSMAMDMEPTFVYSKMLIDTFVPSAVSTPYRSHWSDDNGPSTSGNTFVPIEQLNASNAHVVLIFMANNAAYFQPVMDPWFDSQVPIERIVNGQRTTLYTARQPVSVLGCVDRTELCNPTLLGTNHQVCVSFALANTKFFREGLRFNTKQLALLTRLYPLLYNTIVDPIYTIGAQGMRASALHRDGSSGALPDDQWVVELENWFGNLIMDIHIRTTQFVTGFGHAEYNKYFRPPVPADKWMCTNHIVRSLDYASFNVLGLSVILIGAATLLLGFSEFTPGLRHRAPKAQDGMVWKACELLELHRRASHWSDSGRASHDGIPEDTRGETSESADSWSWTQRSWYSIPSKDPTVTVVESNGTTAEEYRSAAIAEVVIEENDFPPRELMRCLSLEDLQKACK